TLLTAAVVAVAVGLSVAAIALSRGVQRGIDRAAEPYDLIVGGKGSAQQLVLSTVLLEGTPLGNVPFELYERLQQDAGLTAVVPLAYGDNYRRLKIIGTSAQLFGFRNKPNDPPYFRLRQGRLFEQPFQAVLGSEAARLTRLAPGATFTAEHGDAPGLPDEDD